MKLTVLTQNLKEGLETVSFSIIASGTLPILSYVLMKAKASGLEIIGTNLEIGITTKVRAKVDKEGEVVIPFKLLMEFVNNINDEKIEIEKVEQEVKLKTNHYKAQILSVNAEEFPLLPQINNYKEIKIKKDDFINGAQKVVVAPAMDETRPALAGVLFWLKKNEMSLVGTDSSRLAELKIDQEKKNIEETKVILPLKVVQVLLRILSKSLEKEFVIQISENQVKFKIDDSILVGRLIEGDYPDYEQIIPQSYKTRLLLNKNELSKALKILTSFSQEINKEVVIEVGKKEIKLTANSPQVGANEAVLEGKIEGDTIKIKFNGSFINDGLGVIDESEITLDLTGELSPAILRGVKNEKFTYLVMPLKEE
ncbi:MAG: DNA polymerase III subunit beta [Patescibacteria group bacterium]|nr:DNA polymerase III subunit beta [Patescibacteria group bacterium]